MLTKKATKALHDIAEGNRDAVSDQMMRRLESRWLIELDGRKGGWVLTPHGWNSLSQAQ